jgi:hypothetical protein
LLLLFIVAGYLLREQEFITPKQGIGYWLGITGGIMMLVLLLYPLRKRLRFLRFLGATKHWFRIHMAFGLMGPLLILYHCNFKLGSINSQVALYCMMLVAGSGIIGRHVKKATVESPGYFPRLLHDSISSLRNCRAAASRSH